MQPLLEGLRVIDLSSVILGPYCTMILADMGADVIKIEPPEGDMLRQTGASAVTPAMGPLHMALNRGKRSVMLDLKLEADREKLRELLESADVFIHNIRAKAIERLGFGYDAVKALNPNIVYVHCVGFGAGGPYSDLPAYDDVIQGLSGLATLIPRLDGTPAPRYLPTAMADKVTGLHAAYATLAALFNRERTGEGRRVEVPMLESVASFTMIEHLFGQTFVPPNGDVGFNALFQPHKQPFKTADGYLSIVAYTEYNLAEFFKAAELTDILEEPRFATPENRTKNIALLFEAMAKATPSRTTAEWQEILGKTKLAHMPVNDLGEVIHDPHLVATGFFQERQHATEGTYLEATAPVRFAGIPVSDPIPPPTIGQHTQEVLAELRSA